MGARKPQQFDIRQSPETLVEVLGEEVRSLNSLVNKLEERQKITETFFVDSEGLTANRILKYMRNVKQENTHDDRMPDKAGLNGDHDRRYYVRKGNTVIHNDGRVSVGTKAINGSAVAQFDSTTGAVMLPGMTTVERDALTPTDRMVIYNSTTSKFQGRAGGAWVDLH